MVATMANQRLAASHKTVHVAGEYLELACVRHDTERTAIIPALDPSPRILPRFGQALPVVLLAPGVLLTRFRPSSQYSASTQRDNFS